MLCVVMLPLRLHTPPSLWLRYRRQHTSAKVTGGGGVKCCDSCMFDVSHVNSLYTFCILNKYHINDFRTHLNSICSLIQFTIEKEHNFSLPFLDVLVKRNSRNGSITTHSLLSTTIYRKPTHTNRYLH